MAAPLQVNEDDRKEGGSGSLSSLGTNREDWSHRQVDARSGTGSCGAWRGRHIYGHQFGDDAELHPASMVRRYNYALDQFLAFLGTKADRDIVSVRSAEVLRFRDEQARVLSRNTAN